MLSMIDAGAAQLNDKINLFKNEAKFPEVFRSAVPQFCVEQHVQIVMPLVCFLRNHKCSCNSVFSCGEGITAGRSLHQTLVSKILCNRFVLLMTGVSAMCLQPRQTCSRSC